MTEPKGGEAPWTSEAARASGARSSPSDAVGGRLEARGGLQPLRITAHLLAGASYHPGEMVSLDGPLLYAVTLERFGEAFFEPPGATEIARETAEPDPDMPLAVHVTGGRWIYACSLSEPHGHHGTTRLHFNTRIDTEAIQHAMERGEIELGRTTKVQTNSGQYKSMHAPLYIEDVDALVWYAVGDGDRIRELLESHVHHVGKKRNTGHGAVTHWDVEPWDGPPDRWLWREPDVPARAIPVEMLGREWVGATAWMSVIPPYWITGREQLCAIAEPVRVG